jgi:hypothetical protein
LTSLLGGLLAKNAKNADFNEKRLRLDSDEEKMKNEVFLRQK